MLIGFSGSAICPLEVLMYVASNPFVADHYKLPRLHIAYRGRVMGGSQQSSNHVVRDICLGELGAHIPSACYRAVDAPPLGVLKAIRGFNVHVAIIYPHLVVAKEGGEERSSADLGCHSDRNARIGSTLVAFLAGM